MPTEVLLPQWGMGMQEGTVTSWLRRVGDPVVEGAPLVEVEAEKLTEVIDAPASGVLGRILVQEGESAEIYSVLALIVAPDETLPDETGAPATPTASNDTVSAHTSSSPPGQGDSLTAEPRARRLAQELGIDISDVAGTGPGGRVTEEDVRAHAAGES